jgi:hypothetical protein
MSAPFTSPRDQVIARSVIGRQKFRFIDAHCHAMAASHLLGPVGVSITAQDTLKKADLLGNDIDRFVSLERFGDRTAGFNCR